MSCLAGRRGRSGWVVVRPHRKTCSIAAFFRWATRLPRFSASHDAGTPWLVPSARPLPNISGFVFHAAPDVQPRRRTISPAAISPSMPWPAARRRPGGPYGRTDLEARVLRHVGPAMRIGPHPAARPLYCPLCRFSVAPEALALCSAMVAAGKADHLVPSGLAGACQGGCSKTALPHDRRVAGHCGATTPAPRSGLLLFGVPQQTRYHRKSVRPPYRWSSTAFTAHFRKA